MRVIAVQDSHQHDFVEYNDAHFAIKHDDGSVSGWYDTYEEAEREIERSRPPSSYWESD